MKPIMINVQRYRSIETEQMTCQYCIMRREQFNWLHLWHNGSSVRFRTLEEAKEYCRLYLAVRRWWRGRGRRVWL